MKISILIALMAISIEVTAQFSKAEILADIDVLEELIQEKHVSPFWLNSEEHVNDVITQAKKTILSMPECDERCLVELMKIVASLRDGHSSVGGSSRYELFGYLPLSTRWFDGELRVMRTIKQYENILGSKVTAVNGMPISEVLELLKTVVPQANEYRFQKFAGSYLHLPGLLFGLGIIQDPKKATFTFKNGKQSFDILLQDLSPEEEEKATFVSYLDTKRKLALYQQNNSDYYWYNYNPKSELFYFQYNRVGNMKNEGSSDFARRMWKAVDSLEVGKFVLDLRYNGGGSFPYSLRFIQGILDRLDIDRRGNLFIITGYDTFSAAMDMLNMLELNSRAIVVGEYPCDHPSRPGDPEDYQLPNTNITVYLSSLYHPTALTEDQRTTSSLDREIITTWKDYDAGRDPVMEYIESFDQTSEIGIPANVFAEALGSYDYTPTRDIRLKEMDDNLWLEISRALVTPVYAAGEGNRLKTEIPEMELEIIPGSLILYYPDGRKIAYPYKAKNRKAAVDYLYENDLQNARAAYLKIKETEADFIELQDHMMSFLANLVYFELLKYPDVEASALARGILELGIELNDGNAPFCEFSLRFYQ